MYVYVGVWSRDLYWEALTEDRTTQKSGYNIYEG